MWSSSFCVIILVDICFAESRFRFVMSTRSFLICTFDSVTYFPAFWSSLCGWCAWECVLVYHLLTTSWVVQSVGLGNHLYPHDTILVWVLAVIICVCVCVCVCMCVRCQYCVKTAAQIMLIIYIQVSLDLAYFKNLQNKGISLWNFVPNSGLRKFCHGTLLVSAI